MMPPSLVTVFQAISAAPDGVVLVDEVENGIHHSAMAKVWRAIDKVSTQLNTQVFATTHSFECVSAAHESLCEDDFRLHRLDVIDNSVRCVTYEPETIAAALRHNLEVR
jgi:AAA15 family ATPase/GTPase